MVKNCYKKIVSDKKELVLNSFPSGICEQCIEGCDVDYKKTHCPYENAGRWIGKRESKNGIAIICTNYGKNQGFISDFDIVFSSLKMINITKDEISKYREEDSIRRIRRVLHNIRTINAHSLMEIRGIIPESFFRQNLKEVLKDAATHIKTNYEKTAHGILEIAKDLYSIKTEFSVYDKLIKGHVALDKKPFNVRDVLMTVVYPFFGDFTKKNVHIDIHPYRDRILLDFETIQVALYHIIENTSKYVKPNTVVEISFPRTNNEQRIVFKMTSLFIEKHEFDLIFSEGYSGEQAKKAKQEGEGIGLYRAKRLVELNKGDLTINAGDDVIIYQDLRYATNEFIFTLPLN
jgi:light-regulated signal transduction histidine kinase (bacteriophytochrome)